MKSNPKDILIALDDGHGMETAGKRTPKFENGTFMHENDFNKEVVRMLDVILRGIGFDTILVAPTDEDTSLSDRVRVANYSNCDIYVSVHANAMKGAWGSWRGIETYHHPNSKQGKILAEYVHGNLMNGTTMYDRGIKTNTFYVLRKTYMPAVLVECGFMDNKREAELLMSYEYRKECAEEIARGICQYYGVTYAHEVQQFPDVDLNGQHKWGKEALNYFIDNDLIRGDENGMLHPDKPLTRLQGVVLLYRIIKFISRKER